MKRQYNYKIHKILRQQGLNQRQLSNRCGLHETRVSEIVRGAWVPNKTEQGKVAKALNVEAKEIFGE
jgi:transcriptional regulator with XRE-family HTH domain